MSEWMKHLIKLKTSMVPCDVCHTLTTEYVEDWVKINGVKQTFIRCKCCQEELEKYSENPGDGLFNDDD